MKKYIISAVIAACAFTACADNGNEKKSENPFEPPFEKIDDKVKESEKSFGTSLSFKEYLVDYGLDIKNYEGLDENTAYVVSSSEEYEELFGETPEPAIDFSAGTLLFMQGEFCNGGWNIDKVGFYYNEEADRYTYHVETSITYSDEYAFHEAIVPWYAFVLVDPLPPGAVVEGKADYIEHYE